MSFLDSLPEINFCGYCMFHKKGHCYRFPPSIPIFGAVVNQEADKSKFATVGVAFPPVEMNDPICGEFIMGKSFGMVEINFKGGRIEENEEE